MQENAPQWDPMTIDYVMPWEIRLLVITCFFGCIFLLVRAVQVGSFLWRSRHFATSGSVPAETSAQAARQYREALALASVRTASLRRGSFLILLLSFSVLAIQVTATLHRATTQPYIGPAFITGSFAQPMAAFAFGMMVCSAFYAAFALLEGKLARLEMLLKFKQQGDH
jgi:hypothetical protein